MPLKISVITPSFNQARFLPTTIESVRAQTHADTEHIIVDPGSTDGSREIARKAEHTILLAEPDRGQSDGITKGFAKATGDILTWLNSDDFYPNKEVLKAVADTFELHPDVDVVYGGVDFVDETGAFLRKGFVNDKPDTLLESFMYQVGIVQPGVFLRRSVFERLGGPSEEYEYCMDYEYWVRMANAGLKWQYLDQKLAHHRWWDGMKTSRARGDSLIEHMRVCVSYFGYIHWKWIDRYADFVATGNDGIVNLSESKSSQSKSECIKGIVGQFVTQNILRLLEKGDHPEHLATLSYIKKTNSAFRRFYWDASELDIASETHSDPEAHTRPAWRIMSAKAKDGREFRSYHVPENFDRYFEKGWFNAAKARGVEKLKALARNRNETCVIVGNGPSLSLVDLSLLQDVDVIISNFAVMNPQLLSLASICTVTNDLVATQGSVDFNRLDTAKVMPFWLANNVNETESTAFVEATVEPRFCAELDGVFSWRSTVSYFNMQLAYALGYTKVLLVGFDHSYIQPAGVKEGDLIQQKSDDENHFDPRYFKGKTWQAADTDNMEAMYRVANEAFTSDGREIINCTAGGQLEVFPRADLNSMVARDKPRPRLLLIDHTRIGDATATGELKSSLFQNWPSDRLLQLFTSGRSKIGLSLGDSITMFDFAATSAFKKIEKQIEAFNPEIILYRPAPVPNTEAFHTAAMSIVDNSNLPLITWIMDDWPTTQATSRYHAFDQLEADWRGLIQRAALRFSISEDMSTAFGERYGVPFTTFANGVDPENWAKAVQRTAKGPVRIRYAGSLAENMTLHSVGLIAEAVESLAAEGVDIIFEIKTRELWRQIAAPHYKSYSHTKFIVAESDIQEYRAWLSAADIVVIAYNFDDASTNYIRYSIANKLPECLASGAALLAVGPADVATMKLLARIDCSACVTKNDLSLVKNTLAELASSPAIRFALAQKAQQTAFEEFDIRKINAEFTASITKAAAQPHTNLAGTSREVQAHVDETAVIAKILEARKGREYIMLDVGAHHGSSAQYFHQLGWTIHCFEPDANNRQKLIAQFGRSENITIDTRAVSETSATDVSFFSSKESTGISGLHAFRDTHRETGLVDVTTVAEIATVRGLKHVDFLKIDVEGFDFCVLKGVPWEELVPDVIECEFEDAKTAPMGHTWRDIAEFLVEKGYSVYLSEWHPIIRYGIRHDWRRIVPFPGIDVASNAWGNILAFREDPGYEVVNSAFATVLKIHSPKSKQQSATPNVMIASDLPSTYVRLARTVRRRAPRFFALARFAKRSVGHILRRGVWTLPLLIAFGGVAALGVHPAFADHRFIIWSGAAFAALAIFVAYVAFRTYIVAERLSAEKQSLKRTFSKIDTTLAELKKRTIDAEHKAAILGQRVVDDESRISELSKSLLEIDKRDAQSSARFIEALSAMKEDITQEVVNQKEQTIERLADVDATLKKMPNNASWYQHFNRQLKREHIETIQNEWGPRLSIDIAGSELGYLANRACQLETMLSGRLAASIEDILLRTFVARGIQSRDIEILEIGTLFGAGAAIMYDSLAPHFDSLHFTLLDPLDGYYDSSQNDILTGQPVNEKALRQNLQRAGLAEENFTLIKKLSTETEAMDAARTREYDVLVIDGDHSYAGVKADFDNYAPMVRLGGYIIIDDYGSEDWPDVTRFVDTELEHAEFVTPVGVSWRTCVYRVVKPQDRTPAGLG